MGLFLPVCSAANTKLMPDPKPESILVSVASCGTESATKKLQDVIEMVKPRKLILDNGMYSFFTKLQNGDRMIFDDSRPIYPKNVGMNLTAVHVIQAAMVLKPDVMIVPDLPVQRLLKADKRDHGDEEFNFMGVTYHNLTRAEEITQLRAKYCPDVELYYTFQGYTLYHFERIMRELNGLQFEGYCLATRVLSWNKILAIMILLRQHGVKKIHILAGSNMPTMAVGAFAARHLFEEVSYDSRNWLFMANRDMFRFFGSMGATQIIQKVDMPNDILSLTCACHHCNGRSLFDIREMPHSPEKHQFLAKHNYLVETETAKAYFDHSETPTMLRNFLLSVSHRKNLILEMYEALSAVYEMKYYLNDKKVARGIAEHIFNHFKMI